MSKGNLFQGQGRGKVGDVVFSVRNGEQVARVRNRHPYNPRSPKQLMQRAIMATISTAYSAGKDIFDHSFQGKSVGDACANYFFKRNANLLRSQISDQLGKTPYFATACCVNYNPLCPVPNAYMVSEGTLVNNIKVSFDTHGQDYPNFMAFLPEEGMLQGTLGEYVSKHFTNDDLFTLVAFIVRSQDINDALFKSGPAARQYIGSTYLQYCVMPCEFAYIRFGIKESAFTSTKSNWGEGEGSITCGDVFEITDSKGDALDLSETKVEQFMASLLFDGLDFDMLIRRSVLSLTTNKHGLGSMAMIRSKINKDLRSTEYMVNANNYGLERQELIYDQGSWGLTAPIVLQAWQQAITEIADSDLVLEGGDGA